MSVDSASLVVGYCRIHYCHLLSSMVLYSEIERSNIIRTTSAFVFKVISEQAQLLCCLSTSHIVVPGWEDEDVLIVGYTEDPSRKRRKVADEGV